MRPSEVLYRSREAALRVRQINMQLELMREHIWTRGRGMGAGLVTGVLDPARHIDEYMDAKQELLSECESCRQDIAEARELIAGIRVCEGEREAELLERFFCETSADDALQQALTGEDPDQRMALDAAMAYVDSYGIAVLRAAGQSRPAPPGDFTAVA